MGVRLRQVDETDLQHFFSHQDDSEANAMAAFAARTEEEHLAHWARILADPSVETRTIEVEGETAGNIGSWIQDDHREVGYWIGRDFWGRGIATEALGLFVGEVIERPLFAYVAEDNLGSVRVLEKCGFVIAPEQRPAAADDTRHVVFELS